MGRGHFGSELHWVGSPGSLGSTLLLLRGGGAALSGSGRSLRFVHSKRMESGSVSDFDRLLVKTDFLPYLIELCLIGNFLLATPLPQAKIA